MKNALKLSSKISLFLRLNEFEWSKCQSISAITIIEKFEHLHMIRFTSWDDLGNWESVWRAEKKLTKNGDQGPVFQENCEGSLLIAENSTPILGYGLENIVLISTEDGVLQLIRAKPIT